MSIKLFKDSKDGVPEQLALVAHSKQNISGNIVSIEKITMSRRAKNGLFTINNEKALRAKGTLSRVINTFQTGFKLKFQRRSRSRGGYQDYYFLDNDFLPAKYILSYKEYIDIISGCSIVKGVIQDPLIYDGNSFVTEEHLDKILEEKKAHEQKQKKIKDERKPLFVSKKERVVGKLYQYPQSYGDELAPCIYLGEAVYKGKKTQIYKKVIKRSNLSKPIIGSGASEIRRTLFREPTQHVPITETLFGEPIANITTISYKFDTSTSLKLYKFEDPVMIEMAEEYNLFNGMSSQEIQEFVDKFKKHKRFFRDQTHDNLETILGYENLINQ
jgi:hypothetical protein